MAVSSTAFAQQDPWADVRAIDAAAALQAAAGPGAGLPIPLAPGVRELSRSPQRFASASPCPPPRRCRRPRPLPYEDAAPTVASASPADTSLPRCSRPRRRLAKSRLVKPLLATRILAARLRPSPRRRSHPLPALPSQTPRPMPRRMPMPPRPLLFRRPSRPCRPVTVRGGTPGRARSRGETTLSWEIIGAPLNSLFPPAFAAPAMPEPKRSPVGAASGPAPQQLAMGTLTGIFTGSEEPAGEAAHGDAKADGDAKGEGEAAAKAEAPPPPPPPIFRDLRQLQRLQDRMALGEPNALDEQNALSWPSTCSSAASMSAPGRSRAMPGRWCSIC